MNRLRVDGRQQREKTRDRQSATLSKNPFASVSTVPEREGRLTSDWFRLIVEPCLRETLVVRETASSLLPP